jgi:hypothetical protein
MLERAKTRAGRWLFDRRALARRPHLLAVGDSHARVVWDAARLPDLRAGVKMCLVRGATAQGLHNPNSRTNALRTFQQRCEQAPTWQTLVFLLGEVDCGFVIWYRAEKYGVPVESQLQLSIGSYVEFLDRQVQAGFRTLVLSAPLPTIRDGQDWGEVANARREVKAGQRDRTKLTLEYNARLWSACTRIGADFLDVTTPTLDPGTELIRSDYLNPDPTDHHLHPRKYAELVGPAISSALGAHSPRTAAPPAGSLDSQHG